jgi:hypothetical protein
MKFPAFILILLALATAVGLAAEAVWDASSGEFGATIGGYKLYQGNQSGVYTYTNDVGNVTNCPFNPANGIYAAVTCYDDTGLESDYSNEAVWTNLPSGGVGFLLITKP